MIDVAIDAAKQGGALAYSYFKKNLKVAYKADNSPVTIADRQTEKLIRKLIVKNFPHHGIIGEELENTNPKTKYQWVIDPIDGTKEFVRGIKTWSSIVAILENGEPIIGVVCFPYEDEVFWAEKGKGAKLNSSAIKLSSVSKLNLASISIGAPDNFAKRNKIPQLIELCRTAQGRRSLSTLGYNYLWKGQLDAVLEPAGSIWDFAGPSIITKEAGGEFSDFSGKVTIEGETLLLSNGKVHNQVLKILNG